MRDRLLSIEFIRSLLCHWTDKCSVLNKDFSGYVGTKNLSLYNQTLNVINEIIVESKSLAESNNALFVIVLIPDKTQVYGNANTAQIDHFISFGTENNIPVVNLLPYLRDIAKTNKNLYFESDVHFSPEGNKIVGDMLVQKFVDLGIFDEM